MIREAYKVVQDPPLEHDGDTKLPSIIKVDVTDQEGLSWREAKKELRQWYIKQAAALRQITEKDYFPNA